MSLTSRDLERLNEMFVKCLELSRETRSRSGQGTSGRNSAWHGGEGSGGLETWVPAGAPWGGPFPFSQ